MCLVLMAVDAHPRWRLIVAANRDEFYARPTEPAQWWSEGWFGGRDLQSGGTWLGIRRDGRMALVTNVREGLKEEARRSRGLLVTDYMAGGNGPDARVAHEYGGYNIVYGQSSWSYANNRGDERGRTIAAGLHGLSNGGLDVGWPKVARGVKGLRRIVAAPEIDVAALLEVLSDRTPALDVDLPLTGVGLTVERMLSPIFIRSEQYGTRASTVLMIGRDGTIEFVERRFDANGVSGETRETFALGAGEVGTPDRRRA